MENWVCGFCAKVLKTWDDRETHVASHFKDGLTMADWKGYTRPDAEASKKRPTSSEGRPNVLSKLARTLTFRSSREQHHYESQTQGADAFDTAFMSIHAPEAEAPLLPELVFDDFMTGAHTNKASLLMNGTIPRFRMEIKRALTLVAWRKGLLIRRLRL
ncbi:hypothetical protein J4E91_002227 [Alternaria rosae]|nr:hypothetical protein J4E91_002227 [Alternaria rosae]